MPSGIPPPDLIDRFLFIYSEDSDSYLPTHKLVLSNVSPILLEIVFKEWGQDWDDPQEILYIYLRASTEKQATLAYDYYYENYRLELLVEYALSELRSLITGYRKPQIKMSLEDYYPDNWIRTTVLDGWNRAKWSLEVSCVD